MTRSVKEWIGKTDDTQAPPRVRLRVFERHHGVCHISGRKILPSDLWDLEHVKALSLGGENRESNLAPAIREVHKTKTAQDVRLKAKLDRIKKRHLGIKPKSKFACSRDSRFKKKLDGRVVQR